MYNKHLFKSLAVKHFLLYQNIFVLRHKIQLFAKDVIIHIETAWGNDCKDAPSHQSLV